MLVGKSTDDNAAHKTPCGAHKKPKIWFPGRILFSGPMVDYPLKGRKGT